MRPITPNDGRVDAKILPDMMVLLEVARSGSITRAAQRLNMVQSNVTARIQKLEEAMGTALLKRLARGVRPTPAGEAAIAMAMRMDAVLDDLRFAFGGGRTARVAKLRIGAIETVLASHLPGVVSAFLVRHPQVDVSVRTGSSVGLLKQLREGELDAVFVSRAPGLPGFRERLAVRDELVVVSAAGASAGRTEPWRAAGGPLKVLVQRLGCSYTERLLGFLAKEAKRSYQLLELGTLEGILGFAEAGMGIAAMPRAFVTAAASKRRLRLHALPPRMRELETYLVIQGGAESSFAAGAFFDEQG